MDPLEDSETHCETASADTCEGVGRGSSFLLKNSPGVLWGAALRHRRRKRADYRKRTTSSRVQSRYLQMRSRVRRVRFLFFFRLSRVLCSTMPSRNN